MSIQGLFTSWTMKYSLALYNMWLVVELVLGPLRFISKKKKCKSNHATWGPWKAYFHAYIIHCHDPMGFAMGRAKEVISMHMSGDHGRERCQLFFIVMRKWREGEGEKVKHEETLQNCPFWHTFKQTLTYPLFGAWSLLLVHVRFTLRQGPKYFKNAFFRKSHHGSATIPRSVTVEKSPPAWDNLFVVRDVNNASSVSCVKGWTETSPQSSVWRVGTKHPMHWFLGGKAAIIQQGTNVWVGLPSPPVWEVALAKGHFTHKAKCP